MAEIAASPTNKSGVQRLVRWLLESFGPLIVFLAFEHTIGLFAAILSSIVAGVALVAVQIARERKVSPFTAYIAASVAFFGMLELKFQSGFFIKIEPAIGNTLTGLFFLGTVALGRPLIIELAEKQLGRKLEAKAHGYLRAVTRGTNISRSRVVRRDDRRRDGSALPALWRAWFQARRASREASRESGDGSVRQ